MDVKQEVINYFEFPENNGALLITGEWGCGKSYLLREVIDDLEQEYAIAMISLFGLDDVEAVNRRISKEYLELSTGLFGKNAKRAASAAKKVADTVSSIAITPDAVAAVSNGISSVLSIDPLSWVSVKNTVKKNNKKFALVFDDLERSKVDIDTLLGVINEYVENKAIKTVILADESKIQKEKYLELKEKLISRTLKLIPNRSEIIHSILSSITGMDDYKNFLAEHESCQLRAFSDSTYENFRSFKSCIFDFKRVYDTWLKSGIAMFDIDNVLYDFCAITYEHKNGTYKKDKLYGYGIRPFGRDEKEQEEKRKEILDKYIDKTFCYTFSSVSQWIVEGKWDDTQFINDLKYRYSRNELAPEEKIIHWDFWDLTEDEIKKGFPEVYTRACNGELSRNELIVLLQRIHVWREYGIDLSCKVEYSLLSKGFNIRKERIKNSEVTEPPCNTFSEKQQIDKDAIELYDQIESLEGLIYAWDNRKK